MAYAPALAALDSDVPHSAAAAGVLVVAAPAIPGQRGCVVVLSACETAVSDPTVPDEAMSLAGGFLAAGAAAVVASLWPVPDYPTAALMGAFHKELRAGSSPAHALGAAQSAMAAGRLTDADGKDWSSPYVWAGFVALGAA